jgi:hypothetical protein
MTLPSIYDTEDDPNRVGDEDYMPTRAFQERDIDADYDRFVESQMERETNTGEGV